MHARTQAHAYIAAKISCVQSSRLASYPLAYNNPSNSGSASWKQGSYLPGWSPVDVIVSFFAVVVVVIVVVVVVFIVVFVVVVDVLGTVFPV